MSPGNSHLTGNKAGRGKVAEPGSVLLAVIRRGIFIRFLSAIFNFRKSRVNSMKEEL